MLICNVLEPRILTGMVINNVTGGEGARSLMDMVNDVADMCGLVIVIGSVTHAPEDLHNQSRRVDLGGLSTP